MKRVIFLSENLQLGGLCLLELWRKREELDIEIVGVWSNSPPSSQPRAGKEVFQELSQAEISRLPDDPQSDMAYFGGVAIEDYSQLAKEVDLPYQQIPNINASSVGAALQALDVDLGVCIGYGKIFKTPTLEAPKEHWLNFHPSMLPRERGPFPGFWEFRKGAKSSGVSLHLMASDADSGALVGQRAIEISDDMDFRSLLCMQAATAMQMIGAEFAKFLKGDLEPLAQDESQASYSPTPQPVDFVLDGTMSCDMVESFVRGLRGIASPVVLCGEEVYAVEGVFSTSPGPLEASQNEAVGQSKKSAFDRVEFYANDGKVGLLISPLEIGAES